MKTLFAALIALALVGPVYAQTGDPMGTDPGASAPAEPHQKKAKKKHREAGAKKKKKKNR